MYLSRIFAVLYTHAWENPVKLCHRGSTLTSSFEEEKEAMAMALQWIISREPEGRVLICSDSQSLLKAIANESEDMYEVRAKLLQVKGNVVMQ